MMMMDSALVTGEKSNFQFILRLLNTNVDGKQKVMYALTKIKGVGRRYSNLVCKKADVDLNKRCAHPTFSPSYLNIVVSSIENYILQDAMLIAEKITELANSPRRNWSGSSPSFRIPRNTKSRRGSSIVSEISWMEKTVKSWPTVWTASSVTIWND